MVVLLPRGVVLRRTLPESSRVREGKPFNPVQGKPMILENRVTVSLQAGVRLLFGRKQETHVRHMHPKTKRFSRINEPFPKIVPKW